MRGPVEGNIWKQCPCPPPAQGIAAFKCPKRHGTWSFEKKVGVDPVTKDAVRVRGTGYATRKLAEDALAAALVAARAQETPVGPNPRYDLTVGEWLDAWYLAVSTRDTRPEEKTLQGYRTHIPVWKALIGDVLLRELTRRHIDEALKTMAKERTDEDRPTGMHGQWKAKRDPATLTRYRATLSKALTDALLDADIAKFLTSNPALGTFESLLVNKVEKTVARIRPKDIWTAEQTHHFFEFVAPHRWGLLYGCYALTGSRRGEWLGAHYDAFNPSMTSMAVMHSVVALAGWQECLLDGCPGHQARRYKATVKNEESVRWLPLPDQLRLAIQDHRATQAATPKPENYLDHDLVFCEDDGGPVDPNEVTDTFHSLVREAGLPALSGPHALRHFATSMMLAQGAPAEEVSKITGNSVRMIRKVYGHLIEEYARATVQRHADVILHGRALPGFTTTEPGLAGVASLAAAAASRREEVAGQSVGA